MNRIVIALSFFVAIGLFSTSANAGSAQLLLDARTGKVLASENADTLNHPASLTKMMTLYMTFEAIRRGKLSWDSRVPFSQYAASRPPTKLRVKAGDSITVREAVMGMIVKSANDAAAAMAEKLGGTESQFAAMMTAKARSLGMSKTVFVNASGLPDGRQLTTARDMSTLGVALLRDFPKEYKLFNTQSFTFRGKSIRGHNNLMYRYEGMDGIKTGYTNASGFNLVSAVKDGRRRVVGVVMGGRSASGRDKIMASLIKSNIAKASAGSALVASTQTSGIRLASLDDDVPLPVPAPRQDAVAAVIGMANAAPLPATRYGTAYAGPATASSAAAAVESMATAAPPAPVPAASRGTWQIQIAAATSAKAAQDILAEAKAKIGAPLADRGTYTEPVSSRGATLYRARFTGFGSKNEARSVCDRLVKNSYDCVLMPVQG
ncbi:MAG TPA: peptidase M15 [Rhizobium sp.]|nr:peptidase M15 [Rhizobium sp.]